MIKVWAALSKKDVLAKMNLLIQNLNYGNEAWKAGYVRRGSVVGVDEDKDSGIALNSGIGKSTTKMINWRSRAIRGLLSYLMMY